MLDYELDGGQVDLLKEIGNIGAAHAATELSKMLNMKISVSVSQVGLNTYEEVLADLGAWEKPGSATQIKIFGDYKGGMLFLLSLENAKRFSDILLGNLQSEDSALDTMQQQALKFTGNILVTAYLNAISTFCKISLMPSLPRYSIERVDGLVIKMLESLRLQNNEQANILKTDILYSESDLKGSFLLIFPDAELKQILKLMLSQQASSLG